MPGSRPGDILLIIINNIGGVYLDVGGSFACAEIKLYKQTMFIMQCPYPGMCWELIEAVRILWHGVTGGLLCSPLTFNKIVFFVDNSLQKDERWMTFLCIQVEECLERFLFFSQLNSLYRKLMKSLILLIEWQLNYLEIHRSSVGQDSPLSKLN